MAVAARALTLHIPPHIPWPRRTHWQSRAQHHCISTSSVLCDSVTADCAMLQLACKDVWQLPALCYGVLPDSRVMFGGIPPHE